MNTVFFLKGLPASGKTTWAKELLAKRQNVKRINKDDLRFMLDDGVWSKKREWFIIKVRNQLISSALSDGCDVIVDDTNLHPKHLETIEDIAKCYGARVELVDFTSVPVDECIKRDQKRARYVGEKVISDMYYRYLSVVEPIKDVDGLLPAWIFDIDGTLALHGDKRSVYDTEKCEGDLVNESVRTVLNNIKQPRNIFLLSGREDKFRDKTERWLKNNEIEYTGLYMRPTGDSRKDHVVKQELFENHIKGRYNVVAVVDDRLRVCRMWHRLGLPLLRVGDPDADF